MTILPVFAWYDMWVGMYWDRRERRLCVLPLGWWQAQVPRIEDGPFRTLLEAREAITTEYPGEVGPANLLTEDEQGRRYTIDRRYYVEGCKGAYSVVRTAKAHGHKAAKAQPRPAKRKLAQLELFGGGA